MNPGNIRDAGCLDKNGLGPQTYNEFIGGGGLEQIDNKKDTYSNIYNMMDSINAY